LPPVILISRAMTSDTKGSSGSVTPTGVQCRSSSFCISVESSIEYQAASQMIASGLVEEGLDVVRTCAARYDGRIRNPFDQYEAGIGTLVRCLPTRFCRHLAGHDMTRFQKRSI
jgi:hypothetical protein